MQLICLSVTHHNTPVELREALSLSPEAVETAFTGFPIRSDRFAALSEMAVLSTCNRLEIYALVAVESDNGSANEAAFQPVLTYLQEAFHVPAEPAAPYFRRYQGIQAVDHLFRVAAGLDSIALGEPQILGQVSRALEAGLRLGGIRHFLASLFRAAIHAGKRVRSETEIGRHPTSLSAIAVRMAAETAGTLSDRKILVVGAGKMGGYAVAALREHGAGQVVVTNRTYQHAVDMAASFGGTALPFEQLPQGLAEADVVFTSTAALQPVIRPELILQVMQQRPDRPLMLIDLAVPRNVDPKVTDIPNVRLFDMDDLQEFVKDMAESSRQDLGAALAIVESEAAEYENLLRILPFIGGLHQKVEQIRKQEVERALKHLHQPGPQVSEQLDLLSRALVQKILHEPTMRLRNETDPETLSDYVSTLSRLFDLPLNRPERSFQQGELWE